MVGIRGGEGLSIRWLLANSQRLGRAEKRLKAAVQDVFTKQRNWVRH